MKSINSHLTQKYLSRFKSRDLIKVRCDLCRKYFKRRKNNLTYKGCKNIFCSQKCASAAISKSKKLQCTHCGKDIVKKMTEIKKSKTSNLFCNRSCSAKYNNAHKTHGTRKSKLEKWLEEQITLLFPNLNVLYNDVSTINSELDIYIPSLKLAFELNGIFHYEPIYGTKKLAQIQNNDDRKFQACLEHNIELCIIDSSAQKYFKPKTSQKYLDVIVNIIKQKLN